MKNQLKELTATKDVEISKLNKDIRKLVVTNAFATSSFFNDASKTLMTPDIADLMRMGSLLVLLLIL